MEVDVFLKSNIVDLQCEKVQIKGITSLAKENIIVYNDSEALVTDEGISCTLSNFSSNSFKLDRKTPIVWIEKLPVSETNEHFSLFNGDEFQNKILSDIRCLFDNDVEYKTDILSDIRYMFQLDEQINIENTDVLEKYALAENMVDTKISDFQNQGLIESLPSNIKVSHLVEHVEEIKTEILQDIRHLFQYASPINIIITDIPIEQVLADIIEGTEKFYRTCIF